MLFDSHAHLDDEQLYHKIDLVIEEAKRHACSHVLSVATSLHSSQRCLELASRHEMVLASAGIHPNSCHEAQPGDWQEIRRLAEQGDVVALGETGLDGHWDFCPMELQRDYFRRHMQLSRGTGLPFIVHMRDCEPQMLQTLSEAATEGTLNGVMHSFTGSAAAAQQCLEWGLSISFAGMVTYKKNGSLREIAASIPADRLLVETDAPYLSPHPVRGERPNQPSLVRYTLECLAEVRDVAFHDLARQTTENAKRLFGVS